MAQVVMRATRRFTKMAAGSALAAAIALSGTAAMADEEITVRPGDSIGRLARRHGTTPEALLAANPQITDADHIEVGTVLTKPSAPAASGGGSSKRSSTFTYTVQPGDALGSIAAGFGVSTKKLAAANSISNPSRIRVGQQLTITVTNPSFLADLPNRLRERPYRLALMGTFDDAAKQAFVPADLLKAMCWLESGWQQDQISPDGAIGVCQIMPGTAAYLNDVLPGRYLDPYDVEDNILLGAIYLRELLDRFDNTTRTALQAYNQGWKSVIDRGPGKTARDYAAAIIELRSRFVVP
jgi:N-acetylmuramoyl-L-alanine amidase